jgi:hypothetical protein
MSPIELAIIIIGSLGEFAGLAFIAFQVRQTNRDVQYVAALQAAVLLRTDRPTKPLRISRRCFRSEAVTQLSINPRFR